MQLSTRGTDTYRPSSNTHLQCLTNQLDIQHLHHKLQAQLGTEMIVDGA